LSLPNIRLFIAPLFHLTPTINYTQRKVFAADPNRSAESEKWWELQVEKMVRGQIHIFTNFIASVTTSLKTPQKTFTAATTFPLTEP
jgi:hypothetical protein